jgi:hypothetical protein
MRTATRTTSRSRTIRASRSRTRPRSRRYGRDARPIAAIALLVLGLAGLLAAGAYLLRNNWSERPTCVEVIGGDRSESQGSEAVTSRWQDETERIIARAASCEGLVIAEGVFQELGTSEVRHVSFQVDAVNRHYKQRELDKRKEVAKGAIEAVLTQPTRGGTDLLGWLRSVQNHLEDISGDADVNVTLFTDGINTLDPVRMTETDLSEAGVATLIDRIRPDLPDCSGWRIAMLGVNSTRDGGVPSPLAQGAERFWRAYVGACGGDLIRYDAAVQSHNRGR